MFRKFALGLIAAGSLGVAALAPSAASAHGFHHYWGPGWGYGIGLMGEGGVEGTAAALTVIAGALSDLLIGLAIAYRPTSRYGLYAAIAISFTYALVGTILVPRLWADPLGPMLKIWPIIVLHFAALAVLEDR